MVRLPFSAVAFAVALIVPPLAAETGWQSKVDSSVLKSGQNGPTEFILYLNDQANLGRAKAAATKGGKGTAAYLALAATARRSQGPIVAELESRGVEYRAFWIVNMIWVRGGLADVQAMAERNDVRRIDANIWVRLDEPRGMGIASKGTRKNNFPFSHPICTASSTCPQSRNPQRRPGYASGFAQSGKPNLQHIWARKPGSYSCACTKTLSPAAVEWNISQVNADDVWALGVDGAGAVIGGQDTGYDWDHPALVNQYRGWNGTTADHNYNWHDAIHSGGGVCGADSPEPCDDYNHGTHTMGTAVGDDGAGNEIGVAPGARWIGCRNMDVGWGSPASYSECYQFFMAPTDLNDENPDPAKAPDVINNSWACTFTEGCTEPGILLEVVENVRAAGIVTVHSAGNSGSSCNTVSAPAAIYDASFSVGATDFSDAIASLSSRGPVSVDGSFRRKPDVTAPGISIRSCVPGGGYESGWSGTSMAGPHVAGLVALVISGTPILRGQVGAIEHIIEQSAEPLTSSEGCGGDGPSDVPNNTYGWGRVDALAAHTMAVGSPIFDDGFESGDTSAWSLLTSEG